MKWNDPEWRILRGAVGLLAVSAMLGATIGGGAYYFAAEKRAAYEKEQRRLHRARTRYQRLDEEQRIVDEYLPKYEALVERGLIGEERRLTWMESLRSAVVQIKVPSLRWEIGAQEKYRPEMPLNTGVFSVQESKMSLDLGLLHEEDLFSLLEALDRESSGLYTVSGCKITRTRPEFGDNPTRANLDAECTLRWLTLQPKQRGDRGT